MVDGANFDGRVRFCKGDGPVRFAKNAELAGPGRTGLFVEGLTIPDCGLGPDSLSFISTATASSSFSFNSMPLFFRVAAMRCL